MSRLVKVGTTSPAGLVENLGVSLSTLVLNYMYIALEISGVHT